MTALSPLRDYAHNKLSYVFHLIDPLVFQLVLLVEQLVWDGFPTVVYESI